MSGYFDRPNDLHYHMVLQMFRWMNIHPATSNNHADSTVTTMPQYSEHAIHMLQASSQSDNAPSVMSCVLPDYNGVTSMRVCSKWQRRVHTKSVSFCQKAKTVILEHKNPTLKTLYMQCKYLASFIWSTWSLVGSCRSQFNPTLVRLT